MSPSNDGPSMTLARCASWASCGLIDCAPLAPWRCSPHAPFAKLDAQRGAAVGHFGFRRMFLLRQVSSVGVLRLEPLCIDESASAYDG